MCMKFTSKVNIIEEGCSIHSILHYSNEKEITAYNMYCWDSAYNFYTHYVTYSNATG